MIYNYFKFYAFFYNFCQFCRILPKYFLVKFPQSKPLSNKASNINGVPAKPVFNSYPSKNNLCKNPFVIASLCPSLYIL